MSEPITYDGVADTSEASESGTAPEPEEQVEIDIHYEIIKHFSHNLYSSPNKAVEELVVNGFDAFAENVHVFIPGPQVSERVVVWDDGNSMDVGELQRLWSIADSPKAAEDGDRIVTSGEKERRLIGKFGIGKLASYTIGSEITHLCKKDGNYHMVSIDYREVLRDVPRQSAEDEAESESESTDNAEGEEAAGDDNEKFTEDIYPLEQDEAYKKAEEFFEEKPEDFDDIFYNNQSWTLASVSDLKVELSSGRLEWVLGNGMPRRPDFNIYVNGSKVESGVGDDDPWKSWIIAEDDKEELREYLEGSEAVEGEFRFGSEVGLDRNNEDEEVPYVELPHVGKIWGKYEIHENSLKGTRADEQGRSYGFFVMVRDRLVNIEKPELFRPDPSYGAFYRSRYEVHADGLEEDLLANREEFQRSSDKRKEMEALHSFLFSMTRQAKEEMDQDEPDEIEHRLPTNSTKFFRGPLSNLLLSGSEPVEEGEFDFEDPEIRVAALGGLSPLVKIGDDGEGFVVNSSHPFYAYFENEYLDGSTGRTGRKFLSEIERLAASEKILEGLFHEIGASSQLVDDLMEWRDELFRKLAEHEIESFARLEDELEETSRQGDTRFEKKVVEAFERAGFYAEHRGDTGDDDGYVLFPSLKMTESKKLSLEAKGGGSVDNSRLKEGAAAAHMTEADADAALIVARKFDGFEQDRDGEPAIISQCREVSEEDRPVSIIELEALVELLRAIDTYEYSVTNDTVYEVLTTLEEPEEKLARIEQLSEPFDEFDLRGFLEHIWQVQNSREGSAVGATELAHATEFNFEAKDEVKNKLEALYNLVPHRVSYDSDDGDVALLRKPSDVLEAFRRRSETIEATSSE